MDEGGRRSTSRMTSIRNQVEWRLAFTSAGPCRRFIEYVFRSEMFCHHMSNVYPKASLDAGSMHRIASILYVSHIVYSFNQKTMTLVAETLPCNFNQVTLYKQLVIIRFMLMVVCAPHTTNYPILWYVTMRANAPSTYTTCTMWVVRASEAEGACMCHIVVGEARCIIRWWVSILDSGGAATVLDVYTIIVMLCLWFGKWEEKHNQTRRTMQSH